MKERVNQSITQGALSGCEQPEVREEHRWERVKTSLLWSLHFKYWLSDLAPAFAVTCISKRNTKPSFLSCTDLFFFLFASTCWCAGKPVTSYAGRHKFKKTWKAPARGAAWQRVLPSVRIFILWSKATLASLLLTWVEGKLAGLFAVSETD